MSFLKVKWFNKYNRLFVLCFFISLKISFGQVNGISGSKLLVPDAGVVSKGNYEFEPSISVSHSYKQYDANWNLDPLSSSLISSSLQFRITLGITESLEIGTSFTNALDEIFIGSKCVLFSSENTSIVILSGFSVPAGNKSINDSLNDITNRYSIAIGSALSINLNKDASFDAMFSYSNLKGETLFNSILNYGIALGYWVSDYLQGVIELNGYSTYYNSLYSAKFSITPGLTYKFSEKLIFVLGDQYDVFGKNDFQSSNIFSAFTMSF